MYLEQIDLSKTTQTAKKIISYRSTKVIFAISCILFLYVSYQTYIWSVTQSTDNSYVEANISEVSSEVNGIINEILVEENSLVEKKQIIAKIDDTIYQASLNKSNAMLESAKQNTEVIKQKIKLVEIELLKSEETNDFLQKNLKISKDSLYRIKKLTKDNYASQQNLDSAKINYNKSSNSLKQASLNKQLLLEKLTLLNIELVNSESQYKTALSAKILSQYNLDNTIIRSPIQGLIANSSLRSGNFVNQGRVLFSVVPMDKLYIKANFKETQISNFRKDMKVKIFIDAIKGKTIIGNIRNISPATGSKFTLIPSQNATGNFTKIVQRVPVIIDFVCPKELEGKIIPGMSSFVQIRTD